MTKYINGVEIQGTVTDSITTSANNTGTITIGADATRAIGTFETDHNNNNMTVIGEGNFYSDGNITIIS